MGKERRQDEAGCSGMPQPRAQNSTLTSHGPYIEELSYLAAVGQNVKAWEMDRLCLI